MKSIANKNPAPFVRRTVVTGLVMAWALVGFPQAQAQGVGVASPAAITTERDFLDAMPIVLSVSRLPQRLDETPGAVTVLDREMIRLSGARDVADLLLLVPGFQTSSSFESDAPQASYHGGFVSYAARIQVLVDGRSAYAPFLFGSAAPGLQSVAIADIERIEVLRGSNSASYGARAFLGVINIVTRDPLDTLGLKVAGTIGENAIRDTRASMGWSVDAASFRLSLDRRADSGLAGASGPVAVSRVNFRADWRPQANDEVQLRAGNTDISAGVGYLGDVGRPARVRDMGSRYFQMDWQRVLGANSDMTVSYAHSEESIQDNYFYALPAPLGGATVDFGGRSRSDALSVQHTLRVNEGLRFVWGGELRHEEITSRPLYNTDAAQVTDFSRLFGNMEWRVSPSLILNAGGMVEKNSQSMDTFAPRLMLNWHTGEGQTWRAGVSRAYRPPSTFEKSSDVRIVVNGVLLYVSNLALGQVRPESVLAREIGYMGEFPKLGVSLDVRAFHEQLTGFIRSEPYTLPTGTQLLVNDRGQAQANDFVNSEDFAIRGLEYQLKWRPWAGARLIFNQAWTQLGTQVATEILAAPAVASSLIWTQKLAGGVDLSLIHHARSATKLQGSREAFDMQRTDFRLGLPLRFGKQRGELAVVVQNLGAAYLDFDKTLFFQRRGFVTLALDY